MSESIGDIVVTVLPALDEEAMDLLVAEIAKRVEVAVRRGVERAMREGVNPNELTWQD